MQFRWTAESYFHFNALDFAGPIIPTMNTLLEFDLRTCLGKELVNLEISTDNGESWTVIESWTNTGWSNISSVYSINLSAYADTEILVRFNAIYEGGSYYPTGGVWLDNISMTNFQSVNFVERTSDITASLETQTVNISNLTVGKSFYRVQTLNNRVWSDLSPIIETNVHPTPITQMLNVTVNGQGTIYSEPGTNMNCTDNCAQGYAQDTIVTLIPEPETNYYFTGWSGDCTGNGDCTVTMDAAKSVTATFSVNSTFYPVILQSTQSGYPSIQQAYNNIGSSDAIKVKASYSIAESLVLGRDVTTRFEGGYDDLFVGIESVTILNGSLTISAGQVIVSNLIIR